MNAHLMPNLARHIEFLRQCARAPAHEWPSFISAMRDIPRVSFEGGEPAMFLAAMSRNFVRNLCVLKPESESEKRAVLMGLADILQCEFNARYEPPYYVKGET